MDLRGLQTFAFIIAMTNGGPLDATKVFGTYLYKRRSCRGEFGYAAAIAVVLFLALLVTAVFTSA